MADNVRRTKVPIYGAGPAEQRDKTATVLVIVATVAAAAGKVLVTGEFIDFGASVSFQLFLDILGRSRSKECV